METGEDKFIVPLEIARMRIQIRYNEMDEVYENLRSHPSLLLMIFEENRHFSPNQQELIRKKCADVVPTCLISAALDEKKSDAIIRIMKCFNKFDNFEITEIKISQLKKMAFLKTFYDVLCLGNHSNVVKYLLEEKRVPISDFTTIQDHGGSFSPLDFAIINESEDIIRLLVPTKKGGEVFIDQTSDVVRKKIRASLVLERVKNELDEHLELMDDLTIRVTYLDEHPSWPYQMKFKKKNNLWDCEITISGSSHRASTGRNFFKILGRSVLCNFLFHKHSLEHVHHYYLHRAEKIFGDYSESVKLSFDVQKLLLEKKSVLKEHEAIFGGYESLLSKRLPKIMNRILSEKNSTKEEEEEECEGEEEEETEETEENTNIKKRKELVKFKEIHLKLRYDSLSNDTNSSSECVHYKDSSSHTLHLDWNVKKLEKIRLQMLYDKLYCIFLPISACHHILSYLPQTKFLKDHTFHKANQKTKIKLSSVLGTTWKEEPKKKKNNNNKTTNSMLHVKIHPGNGGVAQSFLPQLTFSEGGPTEVEFGFSCVGRYKVKFYQGDDEFCLGEEEVEIFSFEIKCQKRDIVGCLDLQLQEYQKVGKFMKNIKFSISKNNNNNNNEEENILLTHSYNKNNGRFRVMFHEDKTEGVLSTFQKFTLHALVNEVYTTDIHDLVFISSSSITDRIRYLLTDLGVAQENGGGLQHEGGAWGGLRPLGRTRTIHIDRLSLLESSFREIQSLSDQNLLKDRISVTFHNEPGSDAGGLRRSWISLLFREIMEDLFERDEDTKTCQFKKNKNPSDFSKYHFFGRILAKNLVSRNCMCVQGNLSMMLFKNLLDEPVTLKDLQQVDLELMSFFKKIEAMDESQLESMCLTYTFYDPEKMCEEELLPNGENLVVKNQVELSDFFAKYLEKKYDLNRRKERMTREEKEFQQGFFSIIPKQKLVKNSITANDLHYLLEGNLKQGELKKIDLFSLMDYSKDSGVTTEKFEEMKNWWKDILENPQSVQSLKSLLFFFTGAFYIPSMGFKDGLKVRINTNDYGSFRLPTAHTCAHQICIPVYKDLQEFKKAVNIVCSFGYNGYGFS